MKNQNLYKLSFGVNFNFESSSLLEIMLYIQLVNLQVHVIGCCLQLD